MKLSGITATLENGNLTSIKEMSGSLINKDLESQLSSITDSVDRAIAPALNTLHAANSALEQAVTIPDFGNTKKY